MPDALIELEKSWDELKDKLQSARLALKRAIDAGVNDSNAARVLSLQRAADLAESEFRAIEAEIIRCKWRNPSKPGQWR